MPDQTLIRATHGSADTPLKIGEIEIPCYVLEDGRRVLVQSGVLRALGIARGGNTPYSRGDRLSRFTGQPALQPFVSRSILDVIENPIEFKTPKGGRALGYEATILTDVCEAILKARDAGKLQKQQEHIARRADLLMRGFAVVGIVALVDEATGYQAVRDKNALFRILEAYVSKELLPWTKRFPDEFYQEMFRLRGWQYSPLSVSRPGIVGKLTNNIVYERLPPGVLDELQRKNPVISRGRRAHKHHQFLTTDIGNPHLEKHLAIVIALMRASDSYPKFEKLLNKAVPVPNKPIQTEMFADDEDEAL